MITIKNIREHSGMFVVENECHDYEVHKNSILGPAYDFGVISHDGETFFPENDSFIEHDEMYEIMDIMMAISDGDDSEIYIYKNGKSDDDDETEDEQ